PGGLPETGRGGGSEGGEGSGEKVTPDVLMPLVYDELRKLAAAKMRDEPRGHTLDATALVNEAWLKLNGESFASRSGFIRAAAVAMRRILIDHARAKRADKRGTDRRVDYNIDQVSSPDKDAALDELDDALKRLAQAQPQVAELVELRYYAGLSIP